MAPTAVADLPVSGAPTEDAPREGCVVWYGVVISEAERWIEDGLHVIRSTEFDCLAESDDENVVVTEFIDNALDLGALIYDLKQRGEATDHELETLELLNRRFFEVLQIGRSRDAKRRRPFLGIRVSRNRGEHSGNWRQRSTATRGSSLPSPV